MPERDAHKDNRGCVHFKGLFSNMAAYLYPADLATVASQSVHLPCRSGPLGGGRERPPFFWPWFGRGAVACVHPPPRPVGVAPVRIIPAGR